MGAPFIEPGDRVHLLAEVPAGGRIHEIGTSARVLAADGSVLVLDLGGPATETVACPREHVALARLRRAREQAPRVSRARLRPATA